jgi:hypothetical protein
MQTLSRLPFNFSGLSGKEHYAFPFDIVPLPSDRLEMWHLRHRALASAAHSARTIVYPNSGRGTITIDAWQPESPLLHYFSDIRTPLVPTSIYAESLQFGRMDCS